VCLSLSLCVCVDQKSTGVERKQFLQAILQQEGVEEEVSLCVCLLVCVCVSVS